MFYLRGPNISLQISINDKVHITDTSFELQFNAVSFQFKVVLT